MEGQGFTSSAGRLPNIESSGIMTLTEDAT
jgi:hypothetical protein